MKIEIDVSNWDEEQFEGHLVGKILERVQRSVIERVEKKIGEAINGAVMEQIVAVTAAKIEPLVAEIVERGWPMTDTYGAAIGTKSLAMMVREIATAPRRDSYSNKEPLIAEHIKTMVADLVQKELRPAAEEWRKAMRAQLDASLTEAVAKAMRQAMGIS